MPKAMTAMSIEYANRFIDVPFLNYTCYRI
jgi:hypothetical protein